MRNSVSAAWSELLVEAFRCAMHAEASACCLLSAGGLLSKAGCSGSASAFLFLLSFVTTSRLALVLLKLLVRASSRGGIPCGMRGLLVGLRPGHDDSNFVPTAACSPSPLRPSSAAPSAWAPLRAARPLQEGNTNMLRDDETSDMLSQASNRCASVAPISEAPEEGPGYVPRRARICSALA